MVPVDIPQDKVAYRLNVILIVVEDIRIRSVHCPGITCSHRVDEDQVRHVQQGIRVGFVSGGHLLNFPVRVQRNMIRAEKPQVDIQRRGAGTAVIGKSNGALRRIFCIIQRIGNKEKVIIPKACAHGHGSGRGCILDFPALNRRGLPGDNQVILPGGGLAGFGSRCQGNCQQAKSKDQRDDLSHLFCPPHKWCDQVDRQAISLPRAFPSGNQYTAAADLSSASPGNQHRS